MTSVEARAIRTSLTVLFEALRDVDQRSFAELWPEFLGWWATPVSLPRPAEDVLGFELAYASESRELMDVLIFRLVQLPQNALEYGAALSFVVDERWQDMLAQWSDWDEEHPVGFHDWGPGEHGLPAFASSIEVLPVFSLMQATPVISLRIFGQV